MIDTIQRGDGGYDMEPERLEELECWERPYYYEDGKCADVLGLRAETAERHEWVKWSEILPNVTFEEEWYFNKIGEGCSEEELAYIKGVTERHVALKAGNVAIAIMSAIREREKAAEATDLDEAELRGAWK